MATVGIDSSSRNFAQVVAGGGSHALGSEWNLYFLHRRPQQKVSDYMSQVSHVARFGSVEDFWRVMCHVSRAGDLPAVSDEMLFRVGVRPIWEDTPGGGKWMLRLRKGLAGRLWEQLVVALVGEQAGSGVQGAVISIRHSEDILSVWTSKADDQAQTMAIRDSLVRLLHLPASVVLEYKPHRQALEDGASFRRV